MQRAYFCFISWAYLFRLPYSGDFRHAWPGWPGRGPTPLLVCRFRREDQAIHLIRSGQHLLHDSTGNVGESEVAAHMTIGELGVVEAQAVEYGGVQIVDVNRVLDDVQA